MKDTTPILLHFGLVVKDLRRKKQLSQEELANRCGLHRTYITDIEHGTRNVSLKNISKIAHAVEESLHDLFAHVEQYSQHGLNLIAHTSQPHRTHRSPVEILLIEDDQNFAEQTLHELQKGKIGNKVHIARSGEEALKYLFPPNTDQQKSAHSPTVILLDLKLPNISGLDVLERIRREKSTKNIPVVVLTMSTSEVDIERCRQLGVEEYLLKPLNIESFSAVMRAMGFQSLLIDKEKESHS